MNLKKRLAATLVAVLAISTIAACGKKNNASSEKSSSVSSLISDVKVTSESSVAPSSDVKSSGNDKSESISSEKSSTDPETSSESLSPNRASSALIPSNQITEADEETVYNALEYIAGTVEIGTAGSSLKTVDAASYTLDFSIITNISNEDIERISKEYISGVFEPNQFKEQMDALVACAKELVSGDKKEVKERLEEAGVPDSDYPWNGYDMGVLEAMQKAATAAAEGK